ncbi:MAG: adenylosuccinate lyase [Flavobacteriales bacterium]|nr:adenylosuccinate lyase [Flavobacteriales bacterium]|tara:strand:+ start:6869 stop:8221 length:1353 start_codon:yes stop_codon:yes gene_type:complete
MSHSALHAISPIDGRYHDKVKSLSQYFSEAALIKYRIRVEVEYYIALCKLPLAQLNDVSEDQIKALRNIYVNFEEKDALRVKEIEKTTNHDVKAVEYFIKEKLDNTDLKEKLEFIHFGLTSQDINNTAIPLSLRDAVEEVYLNELNEVISELNAFAIEWKDIPMLARTHGQPASPTRLGKEIMVYAERLKEQYNALIDTPFSAKFGGATGNFNAHHVAYPEVDWIEFANEFVNDTLGLFRSQTTTQVEHYDNLARLFDAMKRINTILTDFNRDIWSYISMDYFKQKIKEGEVGSSAMPHKVNPIDFENAEGNLGIANALFEHLAAKLPISRLQRDLTDSTVLRNIGVPIAHTLLAIKSMQKGLGKLLINEAKIKSDLEDNWAVVAEAIQTVLRRENFPKPYEALKDLTRKNEKITAESIAEFIDGLNVSEEIKKELKQITPFNYTGIQLF